METIPHVFPRRPLRIATFFLRKSSRLFWQRGLAMATRELDKEGAERQVLRYRFAVRKLSPVHSLNGACETVTKKVGAFSGGFICWENT